MVFLIFSFSKACVGVNCKTNILRKFGGRSEQVASARKWGRFDQVEGGGGGWVKEKAIRVAGVSCWGLCGENKLDTLWRQPLSKNAEELQLHFSNLQHELWGVSSKDFYYQGAEKEWGAGGGGTLWFLAAGGVEVQLEIGAEECDDLLWMQV